MLALCDEALRFGFASVCLPTSYVPQAVRHVADRLPVCTVVGFPMGYATRQSKLFETRQALDQGAREIDMVIHIGHLHQGEHQAVLDEIAMLKQLCGDAVLKVIVETALLTEPQKIAACRIVTQAGADFIKTSTGLQSGGATLADIHLFADHIGPQVRIKAAGGIRTREQAQALAQAGAHRLGMSAAVKAFDLAQR